MLVIRFSRVGKRNHAQYKVVLTEKTYPVKGKFIELLGSYDPHLKNSSLKEERVKYWLSQGVTCSDSAYNLFVEKGLIEGEKRKVKISPKKKAESEESDEKEVAEPKNEDGSKAAAEEPKIEREKIDEKANEKKEQSEKQEDQPDPVPVEKEKKGSDEKKQETEKEDPKEELKKEPEKTGQKNPEKPEEKKITEKE